VRELREERKKKKKEEEMKSRHCQITIGIILYFVSYSMFFVGPSISFVFKV